MGNGKSSLFSKGLKDGIPIGIGYIPLAMAVSMMAVKNGVPFGPWGLLSALCYSGSAQSAILNLISGGETSILMYILTFSIINCRHILFSLSLAQKTDRNMGFLQRTLFIIFNTDETFAISMQKKGTLHGSYLLGIAVAPYAGWLTGIFSGFLFTSILPASVKSAFGITLYAMFLALVVPPMKRSVSVSIIVFIAASISLFLECVPFINLTSGQIMMICTIVTCLIGAAFFPVREESSAKIEDEDMSESNF